MIFCDPPPPPFECRVWFYLICSVSMEGSRINEHQTRLARICIPSNRAKLYNFSRLHACVRRKRGSLNFFRTSILLLHHAYVCISNNIVTFFRQCNDSVTFLRFVFHKQQCIAIKILVQKIVESTRKYSIFDVE